MASYGKQETAKLKQNLINQLDRLVEQLDDLDKCRDELDVDEYNETKKETMDQLRDLHNSLRKLVKGDISLTSELEAIQLATQAAISEAFQTPEVIRLFGKREPQQLRQKLLSVEHEFKLNKLSISTFEIQKTEILTALRHLGEQLSPSELQFLEKQNNISKIFKINEFEKVEDEF